VHMTAESNLFNKSVDELILHMSILRECDTFACNIGKDTIWISSMRPLSDMLSGYRAIRADSFGELMLFSNGFEIEAEITIESLAKGLRAMEVPITYRKRRGSPAKLNSIGDGARIMKTWFFLAMNARPLFFFGLLAMIFWK